MRSSSSSVVAVSFVRLAEKIQVVLARKKADFGVNMVRVMNPVARYFVFWQGEYSFKNTATCSHS
jgi:hypothetical protein